MVLMVKNPPANAGDTETWVPSLGQEEDPLKEEMATHSSILDWKISWTEEPAGLQSIGLKEQTRLSVSPLTMHLKCLFYSWNAMFLEKKKKFSSLNQSTSLFCFCEYTNFERLFVCSCVFISMTLWISAFLTSLLIQKLPFVFIVCTWTLKI